MAGAHESTSAVSAQLESYESVFLDHADDETLLAVASHDLRNPLASIAFGARTLLMRAREPGEQRVALQIARAAERMDRLVKQLLDAAASQRGGIQLQLDRHDLRELCETIASEYRLSHGQGRVTVTAGEPVSCNCDADRVLELVSNLIGNALQHGQGGAQVEVSLRTEGAFAIAEVVNQGAAIDAARLRLFFDRRAAQAMPRQHRGLGLGLYICQKVAEAHGGFLEADSSGATTTFRVRLPVFGPAANTGEL
jgi:signal transduction histidine kinase